MIAILVLLNILIGSLVICLSFTSSNRFLRGSTFHPFTVLGVMMILTGASFLALPHDTIKVSSELTIPYSVDTVADSLWIFLTFHLLLFCGLSGGVLAAKLNRSAPVGPERPSEQHITGKRLISLTF